MATKNKFLQFVDFRVRLTISDGRMLVGTFLAFDKHLNVVLSETEEFRVLKKKKQGIDYLYKHQGDAERQLKRTLGMVIIRGENIISITIEAPPSQAVRKLDATTGGPGRAVPMQLSSEWFVIYPHNHKILRHNQGRLSANQTYNRLPNMQSKMSPAVWFALDDEDPGQQDVNQYMIFLANSAFSQSVENR